MIGRPRESQVEDILLLIFYMNMTLESLEGFSILDNPLL